MKQTGYFVLLGIADRSVGNYTMIYEHQAMHKQETGMHNRIIKDYPIITRNQMIPQSQSSGQDKKLADLPILFTTQLKLESKSKVQLAYGNTLVANVRHRKGYLINHYSSTGELLASLEVLNLFDFVMITGEDVAIVCEDRGEGLVELRLWNLRTKTSFAIGLPQIKIAPKSLYSIFLFKTTKLLAFAHSTPKLLQLFYYRLPLHADSDPLHTFRNPTDQPVRLVKLNEHSMIGCIPFREQDRYYYGGRGSRGVEWTSYSMKRKGVAGGGWMRHGFEGFLEKKGKLRVQHKLSDENEELEIKDVWEIRPMVFYVQCQNISHAREYLQQAQQQRAQQQQRPGNMDQQQPQTQPENKPQRVYQTYYHSQLTHRTIKSQHPQLVQPHRLQIIGSLRPVNTVQLFYSVSQKRQMPKNVPIFYIDPIIEQIESKYMGEYHKFGYGNFCWPAYQTGSVLEYEYDFYKAYMNVKVRAYCPTWQGLKTVTTFLLTEVIEHCDDDILDGVCGLIEQEEQYQSPYAYLQDLEEIKQMKAQ